MIHNPQFKEGKIIIQGNMKNGHKEKFEEILTENVQLEKVRITEFNGRIFPIFNTPLKLDCIC